MRANPAAPNVLRCPSMASDTGEAEERGKERENEVDGLGRVGVGREEQREDGRVGVLTGPCAGQVRGVSRQRLLLERVPGRFTDH